MAVPAFIAAGALAVGNSANPTCAYPATVNADDIALLLCMNDGGFNVNTWPTGFTKITGKNQGGTNAQNLEVAFKRCNGSEDSASITPAWGNGSTRYAQLFTFSGCISSGDPFDGAVSSGDGNTVSNAAHPALTTSGVDELGVHLYSGYKGTGTGNCTSTPDATWTERADNTLNGTSVNTMFVCETKDLTSAGTTPAVNSSMAFNRGYVSLTLALMSGVAYSSIPKNLFFGDIA